MRQRAPPSFNFARTSGGPAMRGRLLIAFVAAILAFWGANVAEWALITARCDVPSPAAWTSEAALSGAFGAATYLWLRLRRLRGTLSSDERSRVELEKAQRLAAAIQRHLLKSPGALPPVAWDARLKPARDVGGDFYDVLTLPDGSVLFLAADVSGKGVPAAIAAATTLAGFRQMARQTAHLPTLAATLSRAIHEDDGGPPYMTAILCLVDPTRGVLRYVNAGHPAGRLAGPGGVMRLESTGPPLGLLSAAEWATRSVDARPFTLGLLVTDGVVEALAGEGDADAIVDSLAAGLFRSTPEVACATVMRRVMRASPSPDALPDDCTVLALVPGRRGV